MHQFLCRIYVNMRIKTLFAVIRDFPESKAATEVLPRKNQQETGAPHVVKSAFESHLLHPGVHMSDILTAYVSAIKAR